jgi:hypothetical protein
MENNFNQSGPPSQGAYKELWSATHPGCLILLLDQSGSMQDPFGGDIGKGKKKCEMVATVLNDLLHEFVLVNTKGPEVRPRVEVTAIGYNVTLVEGSPSINLTCVLPGTSDVKPFLNLAELAKAPIDVETREKIEVDDTCNSVRIPVRFPIWFRAAADGGTPMCAALRRAAELAANWVAGQNADGAPREKANYPPVIINITDGMATDVQDKNNPEPDMVGAAEQVMNVKTDDGTALLFNCHLTDKNTSPVPFPADPSELPSDPFAQILFKMSSVLPETARGYVKQETGTDLQPGARGFIFNGNILDVRKMVKCASIANMNQADNR